MKTIASYTPDRFPFAAIFIALTNYAQSHQVSPIELYLMYQKARQRARLTPCPDYASTSITSGGHARRPGLKMAQIIDANTRTARTMVALMEQQGTLDAESVVLPVDLGHVPGWTQSHYIHFWLLVISGPDIWVRPRGNALKVYEQCLEQAFVVHSVNLKVMNSVELTATERAPEYFRFADACITAARDAKVDVRATPSRKIMSLVDPHISLGGQTERYFARNINIPVYLPRAVQPAQTVGDVLTVRELARDVEVIISYGGTVCEVADGSALICLRDDQLRPADIERIHGGMHRAPENAPSRAREK
jgi:hypothetical protein